MVCSREVPKPHSTATGTLTKQTPRQSAVRLTILLGSDTSLSRLRVVKKFIKVTRMLFIRSRAIVARIVLRMFRLLPVLQ